MEWSVCEARERGAGLALVFASGAELERFIAAVEQAFCALTEWSERGAGLALVFASGAELERLIAAVEKAFYALTSEPFPLSVVDGSKSACSAAHAKYEAAWSHMLPNQ
ncbi:unnamed protein product [Plutella xylostella]|uniref:(diamondback moth) hypothetical protein n=1 Tax=Plutella xylostella TaxID=51655 RepID=A0A8S4E962_PLUXY|nr:unnamed protein product [Plutella xylostella]